MTETKYDYTRLTHLQCQRKARLEAARQIVDQAQSEDRDLHQAEVEAVEAVEEAVKTLDVEIKAQSSAMLKAVLGSPDSPGGEDGTRFLSLRTPGVKAGLTTRVGSALGT